MSREKKYIVGTNSLDYNPKRNFGGLPFRDFTVQKKMDLFRMIDHIYFRLKHKSHLFFSNAFFDMGLNRVSLYHFFNTVPITSRPWVVTFENELPRPYLRSERLVKRLARPNCIKIIAFCERARQTELFLLGKYPQYKQAIAEKLIVLQPSQQLHVQSAAEKNYDGPVTFTFVGVDFFRKGGAEILEAAEKLIAEGFDFRLNIVSRLKKGHWKDAHVTPQHIEKAKATIAKYPGVITHHYSLAGDKVLELFKESHVGLLPSFGETYGYVVLEAQACGCAVITNDMPPFSEFNNTAIGWMIPVPLTARHGTFDSDLSGDNLQRFQTAVSKGLYESMKQAITDKALLKQKAAAAIEHIRNDHSPEKNAAFIEAIYNSAIKK